MNEEKLWQRSKTRIHFNNDDMDFYLNWVLGMQTDEGASHGECFYAASKIKDGDPVSWAREWRALAERVVIHAQQSAQLGHRLTARGAYLRAFNYFIAAAIGVHLHDLAFDQLTKRAADCFDHAVSLMDTPIERIQVPFEGKELPGYFMCAGNGDQPRKTLIMIGGGETCFQQLYFWAGAPGVRRGYNVLFIDLPGQGSTPSNGLYFRIDTETPISVVVSYALSRPDVDPNRLALYGISGGGYMVCRAAVYEHRLKALITNTPIIDFHRLATAELPSILLNAPAIIGQAITRLAGFRNEFALIALEKFVWQAGSTSLFEVLQGTRDANINGHIADISCPNLCLCGEGESEEALRQTREYYTALRVPKHARYFSAEEGADAHCQINNFPLMHGVVFDWLDETFA